MLAILAVHPDGALTTDRLGGLLDTNAVVIRRLHGRLRWDGIVETRRGPGGGCALALDPAEITLGRVHRSLRGADDDCAVAGATLTVALKAAEASYGHELDRWTVADVVEGFPSGQFVTAAVTNGGGNHSARP